jgi:EAL domain-containing protein (putative c-di-GMP-specific phosphodiesterase class I)
VDALKIDMSFVTEMETSREALEIIRAILGLASGLGVGVVAEGVETAAQAETLRRMDCRFAQGYYFAKPLTPAAARTYLDKNAVFALEPGVTANHAGT